MRTGFVYNKRFMDHVLSPDHPESPQRLVALTAKMRDTGLDQEVIPVDPVSFDCEPLIEKIHTKQHYESVKAIPGTGPVALLAVAGVVGAVKAVAEGVIQNVFCAMRPPGHHANNYGGEEGFCFFNNVAIAARYAQETFGYKKIAIIDWDYHHGNGTQDVFYSDPSILFFSTHNQFAYPMTGDPSNRGEGEKRGLNINVHLENGTDDEIEMAWDEMLIPAMEQFKPDLILISAGFDGRKNDTIGTFSFTDRCFSLLTKQAMTMASTYCDGRLVSVLEGGYNVDGLAMAACSHIATLHSNLVRGTF